MKKVQIGVVMGGPLINSTFPTNMKVWKKLQKNDATKNAAEDQVLMVDILLIQM